MSFEFADSSLRAIEGFLAERGYQLEQRSEMSEAQRAWLDSAEGQDLQRRFYRGDLSTEVRKAMVEEADRGGVLQLVQTVRSGALNRLKQSGFYVDMEQEATSASGSIDIDEETARVWIGHARKFVEQSLRDVTPQAHSTLPKEMD
jgi:hypothetical protein